ncbi:MAG: hypothetical protein ACOVSR_05950 [Bacteroidia bacterium]
MRRIYPFIPSIIFSLIILTISINSYKGGESKGSDFIFYLSAFVVGFFSFGFACYWSFKKTKNSNLLISMLPLFVWIIAFSPFFVFNYLNEKRYDKANLIILNYDGGYNGVSLFLKKDGTYIFTDFAIWADNYFGEYRITKDTIQLITPIPKDYLKTSKIIIVDENKPFLSTVKNDNRFNKTFKAYPLNEKMQPDTSLNSIEFTVIEDNR